MLDIRQPYLEQATKHYTKHHSRAEQSPTLCQLLVPQPFQARAESRYTAPALPLSKSFQKAFILNVWAISTLLSWEPKVIEVSIIHQHIISQNREIPLEQIAFNRETDQKSLMLCCGFQELGIARNEQCSHNRNKGSNQNITRLQRHMPAGVKQNS